MIWHSSSASEVIKHFEVDDKSGLPNGFVEEKLLKHGQNVTTRLSKPTFKQRFFSQLKSKTVIALIIIAIVSVILTVISGKGDFSALLIIAIVLANALISAYYINKCDLTLDDIHHYSNPNAKVIRDGIIKSVSINTLVPGDIILLEEGDYIPADARIIEANEFRCNEVSLTGAYVPVEKNADAILDEITPIEQRTNMIFSGCSVVHGSAKAIIVSTGFSTEIGKAEAILEQTGDKKLPLEEKLDYISRISNIVVLAICAVVFIISLIQNFHSRDFALMTASILLESVALAVAAIPECLPALTTVVIAIGINRILKEKIIFKHPKAAELLGKIDVICCDKTGVFTHNKMSVSKIFDGKKIIDTKHEVVDDTASLIIRLATACSTLNEDSTELAIEKACLAYCSASGQDIDALFPHLATIPFDSIRKTMTVITMINEQPIAIVKGAPEIVVPNCVNCDNNAILEINDSFANEELRNVCIAIKQLDTIPANPTSELIEKDLTFVGLIGIQDDIREGVVEDIAACQKAGIKTIMITGDNLLTARAIARRIGILKNDTFAISGAELDAMSDEELALNIEKYTVFARVSPQAKQRIVKAFKSHNLIVAVTGDSVEDAEALSLADVGCSIGKFGADLAKGNADIIFSNNRFSSIVYAIKESRGLFGNLKKCIYYLFSCNLAEILSSFLGLLLFRTFPVSASGLLWINLLTDSAPAISLSMEPSENEIMTQKRIYNPHKLFDLKSIVALLIQGLTMTVITLIVYLIGKSYGPSIAATMSFTALALSQIFHSINNRFMGSLFGKNIFSNKFMNYSVFISIFIILFLIFTPAGFVFGLTVLDFGKFIISFALSLLIIPVTEILKYFVRKWC